VEISIIPLFAIHTDFYLTLQNLEFYLDYGGEEEKEEEEEKEFPKKEKGNNSTSFQRGEDMLRTMTLMDPTPNTTPTMTPTLN